MDSIVAADRGVLRDVPADTPRAGRLGSPSGRRGRRESGRSRQGSRHGGRPFGADPYFLQYDKAVAGCAQHPIFDHLGSRYPRDQARCVIPSYVTDVQSQNLFN